MWFENIFFHYEGCLFIMLIIRCVLWFCVVSLIYFYFCCMYFVSHHEIAKTNA